MVLHALLVVILSGSACWHILCWPLLCGAYHTRMTEWQNLSAPHALLRRAHPIAGTVKPVNPARDVENYFAKKRMLSSFPARRTYQLHMPCAAPSAQGASHPNDRSVKPAGPARAAGSHFVRERMLAYSVLVAPAEGIPHPNDEAMKSDSPARASAQGASDCRDSEACQPCTRR